MARRTMVRVVLVGSLLTGGVLDAGQAHAHHYAPIQPGGQIYTAGAWCTLNLVFQDDLGELYIGTAAHCSPDVGQRVQTELGAEFGTVVYRAARSTHGPAHDFSLLRIDSDKHHLVDPSIRFWGGPTGIQTEFVPGTPVVQYGQGVFIATTEPTRPRTGVLQMVYGEGGMPDPYDLPGWFLATYGSTGGDSGSMVLTMDGKALGVTIGAAVTWGQPGWVNGPTFARILPELHAAGFQVEVVTAPYRLADPDVVVSSAEHCVAEPVGGQFSDACYRDPYPWARPGWPSPPGVLEEPVRYDGEVWGQGHIRVGGPQTGFRSVTSYERSLRDMLLDEPDPLVGTDSFYLPAPTPGTWIATRTTDHSGLRYDVDIQFANGPGTWYVEPHGCATPAPEEACTVPEGVTELEVVAYWGAMLDVEILILDGPPSSA